MPYMEPRRLVAEYILDNLPDVAAALENRMYPNDVHPKVKEISQVEIPEAYAGGVILPTGLVVEDGAIRLGPYNEPEAISTDNYFRVLLWQYDGRDLISELCEKIGRGLQGERLSTWQGAFAFQWAGTSPSSLDDPSQNNAPMAWVRLQLARIIQ